MFKHYNRISHGAISNFNPFKSSFFTYKEFIIC